MVIHLPQEPSVQLWLFIKGFINNHFIVHKSKIFPNFLICTPDNMYTLMSIYTCIFPSLSIKAKISTERSAGSQSIEQHWTSVQMREKMSRQSKFSVIHQLSLYPPRIGHEWLWNCTERNDCNKFSSKWFFTRLCNVTKKLWKKRKRSRS